MRVLRIAGEGISSLAANKLRTFFMMAGTIVGIAALTVIMAIGKGTEKKVMKRVEVFGPRAMMLIAGGGRALFLRDNHVVVAGATGETPLFSLAALHPAMNGKPLLQPLYVLAAVGVALALDIPPELIRAAMDTCVSLPAPAIQANY